MRQIVVTGSCHVIEHAQLSDGTRPAQLFFRALINNSWTVDPDYDRLPKDAQVEDYTKFLHDCHFLADNGYPERRHHVNDLDDGIWEFKHGKKRLSWFDTRGDGTYEPKYMIDDPDNSQHPDEDAWWFPDMDRQIRLGYAFPKTGQQSGQFNIRQTLKTREEDLQHDRPESV